MVVVRQPWFEKDFTPEEAARLWNFGKGRPYEGDLDTYYTHRVVNALMRAVDEAWRERRGEVEKAASQILRALDEPVTGLLTVTLDGQASSLAGSGFTTIDVGNDGDPEKQVIVESSVTEERLWVRITDEGYGFDPNKVEDPTLDENLCRSHGRGVMLMRAYMTEVHYTERGNCVTLVKTRDCTLPNTD